MEEKKFWFKAKKYGWGWTPASWQGWMVLLLYILVVFLGSFFLNNAPQATAKELLEYWVWFFLATGVFIFICRSMAEPSKWRWGKEKEEMIDVLNSKGEKTGEIVSKSEVHKMGFWHASSAVWILNSKNEFLLQLRSSKKVNRPDMWDASAAGHASAGDTFLQAALRELEEELGYRARPEELQYAGSVSSQEVLNDGTYIDNEFNAVYLLKKDIDIRTLRLQKSEVAKVRWIPAEELRKLIRSSDPTLCPHPAEHKILFNFFDEKYGLDKN